MHAISLQRFKGCSQCAKNENEKELASILNKVLPIMVPYEASASGWRVSVHTWRPQDQQRFPLHLHCQHCTDALATGAAGHWRPQATSKCQLRHQKASCAVAGAMLTACCVSLFTTAESSMVSNAHQGGLVVYKT